MLFLAAINAVLLFALATGFAVFIVGVLVIQMTSERRARFEGRLDQLADHKRKADASVLKSEGNKSDALAKVLDKAAPQLSKALTPKSEKETSKLRQRLSEAGFRSESGLRIFLSLKVISAVFFLMVAGGFAVLFQGFTNPAFLKAIFGLGLGFYLPELVLNYLRSCRKKAIFLGLPDALDLMVVCVESGLGLDQAMRKVADEMKGAYRVVAEEFGISNMQLQMGRQKSQVLQDLGSRTGVEDFRSLASMLIQADKFGSSVGATLRVQSDSMRIRRQQLAEEKAAKTAVKLIFPLVVFIFPGVFVVLVGPAAIQMTRDMFPAMAGSK